MQNFFIYLDSVGKKSISTIETEAKKCGLTVNIKDNISDESDTVVTKDITIMGLNEAISGSYYKSNGNFNQYDRLKYHATGGLMNKYVEIYHSSDRNHYSVKSTKSYLDTDPYSSLKEAFDHYPLGENVQYLHKQKHAIEIRNGEKTIYEVSID